MCNAREKFWQLEKNRPIYVNVTEKEACYFDLIWVRIGLSHLGHLEAYDLRKMKFCSATFV